jgi:hypothetical protein
MSIMALEDVKFSFSSKSLHKFILFLPLLIFDNVRRAAGFST